MGDMLGFVVIAAFAISQWVWIQAQLTRVPTFVGNALANLEDMWRPIRTIIVRQALIASIGLAILEFVILALLSICHQAPFAWWMWLTIGLAITATLLQGAMAVWNYVMGATRVEPAHVEIVPAVTNPVTGVEVTPAYNVDVPDTTVMCHPFPSNVLFGGNVERALSWCHPFKWLFFTAGYMLLQGFMIQLHAVKYEEYLVAQELVLIGLVSKSVYGVASFVVAAALGHLIRKSVRLTERVSTIVAKLVLAVSPHITFASALKEMGGEIDIIDEEYVANLQEFLLTVPFMSFVLYDVIILILPFAWVQWFTLLAVTITGLVAFYFSSKGPDAKEKVSSASKTTGEIAFKLGVPLGILTLMVSMFLFATATGAEVVSTIRDYRYGVRFYAHGSLMIASFSYLFWFVFGLAILFPTTYFVRGKVFNRIETGKWHETVVRGAYYVMIVLCFVGPLIAMGSVLGMFHRAVGNEIVSLDRRHENGSVMIKAAPVTYRGANVMCQDPSNPKRNVNCTMAATVTEPGTRKVLINFTTDRLASGIVEFMDVEMAKSAKMPPYVAVNSQLKDCGGSTGKACEHNASFELPQGVNPGYRLVMRNAEAGTPTIKPDAQYGKVETLALEVTKHPDQFAVAVLHGALAPWMDELNKKFPPAPPPAVTVLHVPPAPTGRHTVSESGGSDRVASSCNGGCDLPRLEVLPQYR